MCNATSLWTAAHTAVVHMQRAHGPLHKHSLTHTHTSTHTHMRVSGGGSISSSNSGGAQRESLYRSVKQAGSRQAAWQAAWRCQRLRPLAGGWLRVDRGKPSSGGTASPPPPPPPPLSPDGIGREDGSRPTRRPPHPHQPDLVTDWPTRSLAFAAVLCTRPASQSNLRFAPKNIASPTAAIT